MKNLHLISTEKYSSLVYSTNKYGGLFKSQYYTPMKEMGDSYKNIYITNEEEIKEGDYFWKPDCNMIFKAEYTPHKGCKKIILTTDADLIKDGVQAIDDEFLKWFVKNPSCEEVEVEFIEDNWGYYEIIIPQEEPKQETHICKYCGVETTQSDDECYAKPETLEENAEKPLYFELVDKKAKSNNTIDLDAYAKGVQDGVIWQQERMYSEEDMRDAIQFGKDIRTEKSYINLNYGSPYVEYEDATLETEEWFKQFKK
jgi:hypothetical protein